MLCQEQVSINLEIVKMRSSEEGRYALLKICLWKADEWMLYAEKNGEASCAILPDFDESEAAELLDRVARGGLSPVQLQDVVSDARANLMT